MRQKIRKTALRILAIAMAILAVISMISPCLQIEAKDSEAVTHARVVIAPLNNTNTNSIDIEVVEEDDVSNWRVNDNWEGFKHMTPHTSLYPGGTSAGQPAVYTGNPRDLPGILDSKKTYVYLNFPGQQYDQEHGITSTDVALANNVSSIMTDSFERLMELINKNGGSSSSEDYSISSVSKKMLNLAEGEDGSGSGSFTVGDLNVTFTPLDQASSYSESKKPDKYKIKDGYSKGTTAKNYCVVSVSKGNAEKGHDVIQFSVPKGYSSGQYAPKAFDTSGDSKAVKYISMKGMAYYATCMEERGYVSGSSAYKLMYGDDDSLITNLTKALFGSIFNTLYKFLGCEDVATLIFNRGARSVSYYEGVTPWRYLDVAQIFYWISMIIAAFMMFYSVYLVVIKHSLADISPAVRIDVKDSIKNLVYVIIMEILFVPAFALLCRLNGLVVSMFSSLVGANVNLTDIGGGSIGIILFSFLTFGMTISINIRYMIRSIVVAMCYAVSPIAIASVSIDNRRSLFNTWLKELLANIFLQAFNAVILSFLLMVTTSTRGLTGFIILYAFMPLNKWFMEDLMGVKSGAGAAAEAAGRGVKQGAGRIGEAAADSAQALLATGIMSQPRLKAPKNMKGGEGPQFDDMKGFLANTGSKTLPEKIADKAKGASGALGVAAAIGAVAAADLSGSKATSSLAKDIGKYAGYGFRRKQQAALGGYSGVKEGVMVHTDEKGNVDGIAYNKEDKKNFDAVRGPGGSWHKGSLNMIDSSKINPETIAAMKDNQNKYFGNEAGEFKPALLTDKKGNSYVVSSAGFAPDMLKKQAEAQKQMGISTSAASRFGLESVPFASVANAATKSFGYESVSNAMAVAMPDGSTQYAMNPEELTQFTRAGGVATDVKQMNKLSDTSFSTAQQKHMVNEDSYAQRMGADAIVSRADGTYVVSNPGNETPKASAYQKDVREELQRNVNYGYAGPAEKCYANYDPYENELFDIVYAEKGADGGYVCDALSDENWTPTEEADSDGCVYREACAHVNKDGIVDKIEPAGSLGDLAEKDGWSLATFKCKNVGPVISPEEYRSINSERYIAAAGDNRTNTPQESTMMVLSTPYQTSEENRRKEENGEMTHASVAEEKFNVEKIQDRACFVKGEELKSGICHGRQVEELSSIVMVGKDHPTPPNVNGVIGKEITTGRYVRSQTGDAVVTVGNDYPTPPDVNGVIGEEVTADKYAPPQTGETVVVVGNDHLTPPDVNGVIGKEITTGRYVPSQTGEAIKADRPYEKAAKMTASQQNNTANNNKGG